MNAAYDDFSLPAEIPIDPAHSLDQSTSRVQAVRDGLPELIKNSKDQYARLGIVSRDDRQIVVVVDSRTRTIGVIDFAGAKDDEFTLWKLWSSRVAGRTDMSADIEAGNGNGGKGFMVRGSEKVSYMESVYEGLRTKMGFKNGILEERYKPGYALEDGVEVRAMPIASPREHLERVLDRLGISFRSLPGNCRSAFSRRGAYTAVVVERIGEWRGRNRARLIDRVLPDLRRHAQAHLTLEGCDVWAAVDGRIEREPLSIDYPDSLPGFESLTKIPVPPLLKDPETGEDVSTGAVDANDHVLALSTSDRQLRLSGDVALNILRVWNERNMVGYWTMSDLEPSAQSAYVYGRVKVPALAAADLAGSDRVGFAHTPLPRAIRNWVTEQVAELVERIRAAQARDERPGDKEKANQTLDEIRNLMRRFLEDEFPGDRPGDEPGGPPEHPRNRPSWGHRLDEIVLETTRDLVAVAAGTKVPLEFSCVEIGANGERLPVRHPDLQIISDPPDGLELVDGSELHASKVGEFIAKLVDPNTGIESNEIIVESVAVSGIQLDGPQEKLKRGERRRIGASFDTDKGKRDDILIEGYVEQDRLGNLGRTGMFTAGNEESIALVRVRFGPGATQMDTCQVEIGPDILSREGPGDGADIPHILLCGEEAPGTSDWPRGASRTFEASEYSPSIVEDPRFQNVFWLNHGSAEALQVRRSRGGSSGLMRISTATFSQFLALKCFEILKRLWVRQQSAGAMMTETEFTYRLGIAETRCAKFIALAYAVAVSLRRGDD